MEKYDRIGFCEDSFGRGSLPWRQVDDWPLPGFGRRWSVGWPFWSSNHRCFWPRERFGLALNHPRLLGHESVETTQIYTQVMKRPGIGVRSPLDEG